jgi:ribosomal protein S18 acetylase RimI-like enzyme
VGSGAVNVDEHNHSVYHFYMEIDVQYQILTPVNAQLLEGADVFDNPVDPAQLAALVEDVGQELVFAMAADKVVGMASGNRRLHPDKPPAFFINEVGVNEDMQRRGIGTILSGMLTEVARGKGY